MTAYSPIEAHSNADARPGEDPFRLYKRVGTAMAVGIAMMLAGEFVWNMLAPSDRDFVSFWGAARMALSGAPASAYDGAALHALQARFVTFGSGEMPFPYPPAFMLFVLPFALLPFAPAMAAWSVATFVPYFLVARRMFPQAGWLAAAFPPVFVNAAIGQNAFLTAAAFGGGMLLLNKRPFAAGLLLGCLVLKPQLALLIPVALLAARAWRAIAGAALSSCATLLLGLVVFGPETTSAWVSQMPLYASIARDGLVGWSKLGSAYAALRELGVGETPAFLIHAIIALIAAIAVWRVWRSDADHLGKTAVLASATMLASPYLFQYDALILVFPLLALASTRVSPAWIVALWCLPIVTVLQVYSDWGIVNLNPVLALALLWLSWRTFGTSAGTRETRDLAPALS